MTIKERHLRIEGVLENVSIACDFVVEQAREAGFDERDIHHCYLAVDEACTNIIRHAYHLRDDQPISLSLEGLRHCIRMRLRDYGKHSETGAMKGRAHDLIRPGGLGLHLIRRAFDKVDYILKARGTELVMTKNLDKVQKLKSNGLKS